MNAGYVWITIGVLSTAFSAFAFWYGPHLLNKKEDKDNKPPAERNIFSGNQILAVAGRDVNVNQTVLIDLDKLSELYLAGDNLEKVKARIKEAEEKKLDLHIPKFFESLKQKDRVALSKELDAILDIIPYDPFFRVHKTMLKSNRISQLFNGDAKVVKVIHWDQDISGNEEVKLRIFMKDDDQESLVEKGPFVNNHVSIIDFPFKRKIQFKIEGLGLNIFYPQSIRIGWAEATKKNGEYVVNKNNIEYDPNIRFPGV